MKKNLRACLMAIICVGLVSTAGAATSTISFSSGEDYVQGNIHGQPGDESNNWQTTGRSDRMTVYLGSSFSGDGSYFSVKLSNTNTTENYDAVSTKRFNEISGVFTASYDIYMGSGAGGLEDRSSLALTDGSGNIAVWLSTNANSITSLAYHDGSAWQDVTTGFVSKKWYTVEVSGNTDTDLFDINVYETGASTAVASLTSISFSTAVDNLNFVRISNEDAAVGNAAYYHYYDNLTISNVPLPGSALMMAFGITALICLRRGDS